MPADVYLPPDYTLLLRLLVQPSWPLVLHQFILETIFLRHVRYKILHHITHVKRHPTMPHQLCSISHFPRKPVWAGSPSPSASICHLFWQKIFQNEYHSTSFCGPDDVPLSQTRWWEALKELKLPTPTN